MGILYQKDESIPSEQIGKWRKSNQQFRLQQKKLDNEA